MTQAASTFAQPEEPFLWLDLDAFERNVAEIGGSITRGGKRWRPHVKAIRAPALAQRLIAAGAHGVTCATVHEAEAMVKAGIRDVLVASQVVAPGQLRLLSELNRRASVTVAIDAPEHIALLARAAAAAGVVQPVVVEVEVGLQRAGVSPGDAVVALARQVRAQPGLIFRGLMAWEGHTTRIQDMAARRAAVADAVGPLTDSARRCAAAGIAVDIVSCGGTGTYPLTAEVPGVTEVQAGGGVFGDLRYREDFGMPLSPALFLRATVLSRPSVRRIVCNAGWRYLGVYPKAGRPRTLPDLERIAHSAEHLTLDCKQPVTGYAVGDRIDLEVGYSDATTFLHHQIHAMRQGTLEEVLRLPARTSHEPQAEEET